MTAASSPYHIREASEQDLDALQGLFRQEVVYAQHLAGYYDLEDDFDWETFVRDKLGSKNGAILIAEKDNAVVGFVYVRTQSYDRSKQPRSWRHRLLRRTRAQPNLPLQPLAWGVIEQILVDAKHRRAGIGKALASQAVLWLRGQDIQRIETGIHVDNEASQALFEGLGFTTYRLSMHLIE